MCNSDFASALNQCSLPFLGCPLFSLLHEGSCDCVGWRIVPGLLFFLYFVLFCLSLIFLVCFILIASSFFFAILLFFLVWFSLLLSFCYWCVLLSFWFHCFSWSRRGKGRRWWKKVGWKRENDGEREREKENERKETTKELVKRVDSDDENCCGSCGYHYDLSWISMSEEMVSRSKVRDIWIEFNPFLTKKERVSQEKRIMVLRSTSRQDVSTGDTNGFLEEPARWRNLYPKIEKKFEVICEHRVYINGIYRSETRLYILFPTLGLSHSHRMRWHYTLKIRCKSPRRFAVLFVFFSQTSEFTAINLLFLLCSASQFWFHSARIDSHNPLALLFADTLFNYSQQSSKSQTFFFGPNEGCQIRNFSDDDTINRLTL